MTMRASLKSLAGAATEPAPAATKLREPEAAPAYRPAATRQDARQISGHYKADVAQTLRMLAAEHDREQQDMLAEALNMLFERYGKQTRAVPLGTRKKRAGGN